MKLLLQRGKLVGLLGNISASALMPETNTLCLFQYFVGLRGSPPRLVMTIKLETKLLSF